MKTRKKMVGIVGWRGMVGSVLIERMSEEGDFDLIDVSFFSTSMAGENGPTISGKTFKLLDANNINELEQMDIIISCQGGEYTAAIHSRLRKIWNGYWIDAASNLRLKNSSIIVLDPVNRDLIDQAISNGVKDFIGGNCTVSLMLMGVGGLFKENLVEWMTSSTYQAASGGGARHMRELLKQYQLIGALAKSVEDEPILVQDKRINELLNDNTLPIEQFGTPLALNLIPWIDREVEYGQTKEEWKAGVETNKILGHEERPIPIDGTCVRVGVLRSHSQALTIKLNRKVSLKSIEEIIVNSNEWVEFIPNSVEDTRNRLCPKYVSGNLKIAVGRARFLNGGDEFLNIFTCGDQLLWGAAEPLRRTCQMLVKNSL